MIPSTSREDTLLAVNESLSNEAQKANRLALKTQRRLAEACERIEGLGEALFFLSDKLRASSFLDDPANHQAYEKVVAAFQAVGNPLTGDQP